MITCRKLADRLRVALQVWLKGSGLNEGVSADRFDSIERDAWLLEQFGETPVPERLRDQFAPLVESAGNAVYDHDLDERIETHGEGGDAVYYLSGSPAAAFFAGESFQNGMAALEAAEAHFGIRH